MHQRHRQSLYFYFHLFRGSAQRRVKFEKHISMATVLSMVLTAAVLHAESTRCIFSAQHPDGLLLCNPFPIILDSSSLAWPGFLHIVSSILNQSSTHHCFPSSLLPST